MQELWTETNPIVILSNFSTPIPTKLLDNHSMAPCYRLHISIGHQNEYGIQIHSRQHADNPEHNVQIHNCLST